MNEATWPHADIPPRPTEALLIEQLATLDAQRVLCTSLGRAQAAFVAARQWPTAEVECLYLDLYRAELARAAIGECPPNLTIRCDVDFHTTDVDLAVLPLSSTGEAELTRELLQSAFVRLKLGGTLLASTDNVRDSWLLDELAKLERRVERIVAETGVVYRLVKRQPLKRVRDFSCEVVFRDGERLLRAVTRPGVFSHRHVDPGARRLMEAMTVSAGERVIDIGCGWGAVALAAAARSPDAQVLAIDSHARAIACTSHAAELNGLTNLQVLHTARGDCDQPGSYDLALANPPYYGNFRIAELFLDAAHRALRPQGRIVVVTKLVEWYEEHMSRWFNDIEVSEQRGYQIVAGVRNAK
ncbi:MAG: methyltransferase [Planctomycetaceae bacterium]|nr:methyltransferase [Planctomycetaceae bacterium]